MNVEGRTFLITGGSSGLGAECARRLASLGAGVVLADMKSPEESLADQLGEKLRYVEADITQEKPVRQALQAASDFDGSFGGVVHCAGMIHGEKVLTRQGPGDLEAFRKVIEVNLVGTFNVDRLAAEVLANAEPDDDGERGVLINTSSVAAFDGQVGQAAYAASKGGVASLTVPLMRELAAYGIRVMTIAPGVFETPMMEEVPKKIRRSLEKQIPFPPRFGRPQEFAALVQHIIENRMLNGEVIRLDGGLRMAAE